MTKRQKATLDFIRAYIAKNGYSPSFDEIKEASGLKSKSGVHRIVHALEERGHIVILSNRARSIRLVPPGYITPVAALLEIKRIATMPGGKRLERIAEIAEKAMSV